MVWVRPGKLPANVMVAPNSPSARAQHSTAPAATPGATSGNVTRRKVVQRLAPSVAAASSYRVSAPRSAPSTAMTRNGIATNDWASTTAVVVNGTVIPNVLSSQPPTIPRRPSTSSSATPPTTGGSTIGTVTSARIS